MPTTHRAVACTVCGCVCDDLVVDVASDGHITPRTGACWLAKPWFDSLNAAHPAHATVGDNPVSLDVALDRAAEILRQSKAPLLYGLSRSTTEGQRAATALADHLGATIDTTASTGHAPSILALQQVGESTCTLGEVKQRADLVIFWGCDPATTHPRHIERYCPPKVGRTIVVVDQQRTETAKQADEFYQIEPDNDWNVLWNLRLGLQGHAMASTQFEPLLTKMKTCKFGIIFFGGGLIRGDLAHRTIEALLQLVTDLNLHTRFYARRMRRYGDVAGADSVLAWQTGYPFAVDFSAGYPRYNPGETSGPERLARREVDAAVLIGSEAVQDFSDKALSHLCSIPVIRLDSPGTRCPVPTEVSFTTAVYGLHRPGTAYRMDEVAIPLRVLSNTEYPSDAEVLEGIHRRLKTSVPVATLNY
jgi:formylmethanofuran dehydrogenase subunit B